MKYCLNQVYNEDCLQAMKQIADKYFDLAIVDPPYGINATKMTMGSNKTRKGKGQYPAISTAEKIRKGRLNAGAGKLKNRALNLLPCDWDNEPLDPDYFKELFRISKNQVIWGGNYFDLPPTRGIICWDKMQPWNNFSQFELAWTSFDFPAYMIRISNTGGKNAEQKICATQKPISLYIQTCLKCAKAGDKILDTHGGSLSSVIAFHKMGFEWMAFEKSKWQYDQAMKRLEKYLRKTSMFDFDL